MGITKGDAKSLDYASDAGFTAWGVEHEKASLREL